MSETTRKTVFYCRKSQESEERQALSIPAQIDECHKLAERYGIPTHQLQIVEESKSAKQPGRPKFTKLIEDMFQGKIDYLVCWKLDRLSRNAVDGLNVIHLLEQKAIKKIITIQQQYLPEDNHIMMYLEFGMASQYSRDLSVNVKRGNRKKLEQGWWTGVAPLGYLNNQDKHGKPIIEDPDRFHIIKKLWDLMLTGKYTVPQILAIADDEFKLRTPKRGKLGGQPLSRSGLYNLFNNPFYYGFMKRGDLECWGKHKPMITQEEFEAVQKRLGRNGTTRPQNKQFAFRGVIKCGECGCQVTPEHTLNRHGTLYTYYHCTKKKNSPEYKCSQKSIRLEKLEDQITEALGKIEIPDEFKQWAIDRLNKLNDEEVANRNKNYDTVEKDYRDIQKDIDNLTKMRLRDLIDDAEFMQQKNELLGEKKKLKEHLDGIEHRANHWLELSIRTFEFARHAKSWFKSATLEEKTEILMAIGSGFKLKDGLLDITWSKPFEIIKKNQEGIYTHLKRFEPSNFELKSAQNTGQLVSLENSRLEPSKNAIAKGNFVGKEEDSLVWLGWKDSNPRSRDQNPMPCQLGYTPTILTQKIIGNLSLLRNAYMPSF